MNAVPSHLLTYDDGRRRAKTDSTIVTTQSPALLLIDDDEDDYVIIEDLIEEIETMEIVLDHAATYDEGLRMIKTGQHDMYLIDYRLGPKSGLDVVREAIRDGCRRPLFILTGQGDHDVDVQASESGAAGYLEKAQLDSVVLERLIRYGLVSQQQTPEPARFVARPGDLQLQIALARGATIREAAKAAGVAERTAHRRVADEAFMSEVGRLREDLRTKIVEKVAAQLSDEQFGETETGLGSPD